MESVERILAMEALLDRGTETIERFGLALDEFEAAQDGLAKLSAYYGSTEWFDDVDAYDAGELPADLKCGVLGEDVPYNLLIGYRDMAIRMLEAATKALKA